MSYFDEIISPEDQAEIYMRAWAFSWCLSGRCNIFVLWLVQAACGGK